MSTLHLAPRHLPAPALLLESINARPPAVAAALGVSERQVWRWLAADAMPRPAGLALWWLSPWGQSALVADAHQRVALAEALAAALRRDLAAADARAARLVAAAAPAPAYPAWALSAVRLAA